MGTAAPDARDHMSIAVNRDKLIFAAGRETNEDGKSPFSGTVATTDVFDFSKKQVGELDSASDIPTLRAGTMAFAWCDQVIISGGGSGGQKLGHRQVQAFDVNANR